MKHLLTILVATLLTASCFSQSKKDSLYVLKMDDQHLVMFLNLFTAGREGLMNTGLPANQVKEMQLWSDTTVIRFNNLYNRLHAKPTVLPQKTDSTGKK
jgi:hypothetical protein